MSLIWGDNENGRDSVQFKADDKDYKKYPFEFTSAANTDEGKLEIQTAGGGCLVGTVSLMPADNIDGMRADTIKLLKELDAPIYRWPGGNFVPGCR